MLCLLLLPLLLSPLIAASPATKAPSCPPSKIWNIQGFEIYTPVPGATSDPYLGFVVNSDPTGYVDDGQYGHLCRSQDTGTIINPGEFVGCVNTPTTFYAWDGIRLSMKQEIVCGGVNKTITGSKVVIASKCDFTKDYGLDGEECYAAPSFNITIGEVA